MSSINTETIAGAKRCGRKRGQQDARRYNADWLNFEPSENPYGMDSESAFHEAWQGQYEEAFELNRKTP